MLHEFEADHKRKRRSAIDMSICIRNIQLLDLVAKLPFCSHRQTSHACTLHMNSPFSSPRDTGSEGVFPLPGEGLPVRCAGRLGPTEARGRAASCAPRAGRATPAPAPPAAPAPSAASARDRTSARKPFEWRESGNYVTLTCQSLSMPVSRAHASLYQCQAQDYVPN